MRKMRQVQNVCPISRKGIFDFFLWGMNSLFQRDLWRVHSLLYPKDYKSILLVFNNSNILQLINIQLYYYYWLLEVINT